MPSTRCGRKPATPPWAPRVHPNQTPPWACEGLQDLSCQPLSLLCFCHIRLLLFLKVTKPRSCPCHRAFVPAVPTVHHGLSLVLCSVSQCTIQTLLSVSPSGEGGLSRQPSPLTPVPSSHLPSAPSTNHDLKSMGSNLSSAVLPAR